MTLVDATQDYRSSVRAWLTAHAPGPAAGLTPDEQLRRAREFQAALYAAGYTEDFPRAISSGSARSAT